MKVLVTGASGQLAHAIRQTWSDHDLILPEEAVLDLSQQAAIHSVVAEARPDVVINCGAFTQVDRCESEADLAHLINATAVGWLAEACEAQKAMLIQISTDYVFDGTGTRPYREDDPTNPVSVYGRTKLEGERQAARCSRHLIARTSWLYDAWGKNFLNTMLNAAAQGRALRVVDDQRGAPTTCRALARQLKVAAEQGWQGTGPHHLRRRDHLARLREGDLRGQRPRRRPPPLHHRRLPHPRPAPRLFRTGWESPPQPRPRPHARLEGRPPGSGGGAGWLAHTVQ